MSLPPGWVRAAVEDVCVVNPKHEPSTNRNRAVSFVPMPAVDEYSGEITSAVDRQLSEIWTGYSHFSDNDVIFAKITPCMENGKTAVAKNLTNGIACGSTEFYVFRSGGAIDPHYLWRYLRQTSFRAEAEKHMSGAVGQRRVPRRYLEQHLIPLPPVAEQRRIVAKLDALFARLARARAELDRVPVKALQIRRATLSEIFDSEENLTEFSEVLEDIHAGKNLKCTEQPPRSDEKGVVKVSAVSSERFRASESKTLPSSYQPPERDRILRGDLLIARASGSLDLVGRVALVESCPENLYLSDKILRLVLRADLKQWAYWFLRSPSGRRQIEDAASGISMHNITQASIQKLRFPLPDECRRRVALQRLNTTFAHADRLEAEAARARALLDRLEAAILTKAFKGELVPQDPDDEPASVLLERIRGQRTAAVPATRANRPERAKRS